MKCLPLYLNLFKFQQYFLVFSTQVFTSLITFIPRYFILLDAIVNGIVFLISFSDYSLLEYRIKTDFCVLPMLSLNILTDAHGMWDTHG